MSKIGDLVESSNRAMDEALTMEFISSSGGEMILTINGKKYCYKSSEGSSEELIRKVKSMISRKLFGVAIQFVRKNFILVKGGKGQESCE